MRSKLLIIICLGLMVTSIWAAGTGANQAITAASNNIVLEYSDGIGGTDTKDASMDGISDWTQNVVAIHGLVRNDFTADGSTTGLVNGTPYGFTASVLNRSNENVTISITSGLGGAIRWASTDDADVLAVEDQLAYIGVDAGPISAYAYEHATLSATVAISDTPSTLNVVSYNAFDNAVSSEGLAYGGLASIDYTYATDLIAEGYENVTDALEVTVRNVTITAPAGAPAGTAVPGAKIKYEISVKNNMLSRATAVTIKDLIPAHTHLYFNDAPEVTGEVGDTWTTASFSPQENTANVNVVFSAIDIDPLETATCIYTVTID